MWPAWHLLVARAVRHKWEKKFTPWKSNSLGTDSFSGFFPVQIAGCPAAVTFGPLPKFQPVPPPHCSFINCINLCILDKKISHRGSPCLTESTLGSRIAGEYLQFTMKFISAQELEANISLLVAVKRCQVSREVIYLAYWNRKGSALGILLRSSASSPQPSAGEGGEGVERIQRRVRGTEER